MRWKNRVFILSLSTHGSFVALEVCVRQHPLTAAGIREKLKETFSNIINLSLILVLFCVTVSSYL
jgi:hypothetical protein